MVSLLLLTSNQLMLNTSRVTWFFVATQITLVSLKYKTVLAACYFLVCAYLVN